MARTPTIVLLLFLAAGLVLYLKWPAWSRRTHESFFCTRCGLAKRVDSSRMGPVAYHRTAHWHDTAVSQVIGTNDCSHNWRLYLASRDDRASGTVIVTSRVAEWDLIPTLLGDRLFASDLAAMGKPNEKWQLLVECLSTNGEAAKSLSDWRQALPYKKFSSWWRQSPLGSTNSM